MYRDVAEETGLRFTHRNGRTGRFYVPEVIGAGAAFLDYDGDGDLDVYLVQGGDLGPGVRARDDSDRLFRNEMRPGEPGSLRFTDVTAESGIRATGYGMGVATGDYDGDSHVDLYVLNFGPNQLWRNRGDGTFEDVTERVGADDPRWSVSGAMEDVDGDGLADLVVVNYVDFTFGKHKVCLPEQGYQDYCGPLTWAPASDRLLRNRGDGTFEDVTVAAGFHRAPGNGLGVLPADLDGDGRIDLYVANDWNENRLWRNRGASGFVEDAMLAGCAVSGEGAPEASMGVVAADYDGDGFDDLFLTHLQGETNTLYRNRGGGRFEDVTRAAGLGAPSLPFTGFGTAWTDWDQDGTVDLFVANGAVRLLQTLVDAGDPFPLHQRNQMFRNRGDGTFEEVLPSAEPELHRSEVSRGLAVGDVDNDGDEDLLLANNGGPARLLRNERGRPGAWVGFDVPVGTRVGLIASGETRWRTATRAGGYASAHDPRVRFGLGARRRAVTVELVGPDGSVERVSGLEPGRYHALRAKARD